MNKFKNDLSAGVVVFLVALPLCLGISLASGTPLFSGILAGIIGGLVVGLISDSHTSVSGPSQAMIAVILGGLSLVNDFNILLLAVLIAGVIQIILGWSKLGVIAEYIPSNIIKGLLAGIGIILILKQIPHCVGYDVEPGGDLAFYQINGSNSFSELTHIFTHFSLGAVIICVISLVTLIWWNKISSKSLRFLPAPLIVVLLGVLLNNIFIYLNSPLALENKHLVQLPNLNINNLTSIFIFPDFTSILNPHVWKFAITLAVILSLETLINIEAVDNLDPHKRRTSLNRELIAQGFGNMLSGILGGLPISSAIVRSSVNIDAGAESKKSAIIHGILLMISAIVLASFLNQIPLVSLATILLVTGYKLAKIQVFKDTFKEGSNQFIPFIVTVIAIVFTDLLVGVLIGAGVSLFFVIHSSYNKPFSIQNHKIHSKETIRIELPDQVSFFNKATIKQTLWDIPKDSRVIIDASHSDFIEHDILEMINNFKLIVAPERNIKLNIIGLKSKYQFNDHIQFVEVMDKQTQDSLTPEKILTTLQQGNDRFTQGKWLKKYFHQQALATSFGQYPMAAIVGCIDSRTTPEILFDSNLGDLLTIRVAGNVITEGVISSLEMSCVKIGAKLIVIMGHEDCGAIKLSLHEPYENNMDLITNKIKKAIDYCGCGHVPYDLSMIDKDTFKKITLGNVDYAIKEIFEKSPLLTQLIKEGKIGLVGAYHSTETGVVVFKPLSIYP